MIAYAGEDVEWGEHSSIVGGNANSCSHCGNQCGGFSGNWESTSLRTQQFHSWEYTQEMPYKSICPTMFIAALFVIARTWKQPRCPSIEEWLKKVWNIYTIEFYSIVKKQWHLEFCMQMDGHRKHFTEWGNPDPKRGIWYVFTHKWILAIIKGLWVYYSWS